MLNPSRTETRPATDRGQAAIVVLSDRAIIRDCIVEFLRRNGFPRAVGRTRWAALRRTSALGKPALLLLDLGQEGDDVTEVLRELHELWPTTTAVAIGTPMQLAAQAAHADGWLKLSDSGAALARIAAAATRRHRGRLKFRPAPEIERQLRTWSALTSRQRQVLALLGCGVDNHKLAELLGVSERAVKAHVSALLDLFKADSRTELAVIACHAGPHCPTGQNPFVT